MVAFPDPRRRHPFHMHDMILGQPAFVEEALQRTAAADGGSFLGRPRRLVLTGCGTSFHAAMYGARVFHEVMPSVPVLAIHAYDLAFGSSVPADATVLGVSHSGSTPTTNRSEEHTSELQSLAYLVCRLLLEKKKTKRSNKRMPATSACRCTIGLTGSGFSGNRKIRQKKGSRFQTSRNAAQSIRASPTAICSS